jgi:hypothetical protein
VLAAAAGAVAGAGTLAAVVGGGAAVAGGADWVGAAVCVALDAHAAINQLVPPNAASRKTSRRVSLAFMARSSCVVRRRR